MDRPERETSRHGDNDCIDADDDLDARGRKILSLLDKLEQAVEDVTSIAWEREYERIDLIEDIQSLEQLLKERVIPSNPEDLPPRLKNMLAADVDERVEKLEAGLRAVWSKNWEFEYRCKDMEEDFEKLQMQLRNSVPVSDIEYPARKPRTALEKALENRIVELKGRIRNPKGRGRSSSM